MSQISAAAVNELRKRTDMPLMECKSALVEADGDMDKAIDVLRSRNSKVVAKRGGNETAEGRVGIAIDGSAAAIIEVRCESAPVTKSDQFIALVNDLADAVVKIKPGSVEQFVSEPMPTGSGTVEERVAEVIGLIRENMKVHKFERLEGGPFGQYIHHDGTLGVLLQVKGATQNDELLRDVCAHIAALNPPYMKVEDVPADVVAKEKDLIETTLKEDESMANKPANILEKIVEGRMRNWYAEGVLLEQPIANQAKYEKKTVGQVLSGAGFEIVKCVRYKVGEIAA